ncbi:polysaccharide lyase 8 family protein [Bailinhaonella thermotolerans]|uniref:polysaccharide lyase 8 family protein n=1 Tax=Bailinhaonella thermotolerans TaxID=1070861 RepID=UPI00192A44C6|nr:polysaccharide lyase 8 family protein [Bailinhaonella thermotolerans]
MTTAGAAIIPVPAHAGGDPFAALRQRWAGLLVGSGYDPAAQPYATRLAELGDTARRRRDTMTPAGTSLWPDLPLGTASSSITGSYLRLRTMALAHTMPGTGLTGTLAAEVQAGLDFLYGRAYNERATSYDNWWDWQIGTPLALLDCCALIGESRPGYLAAVDRFVPDSAVATYTGNSTGANRVDLCKVIALRGALGASPTKLALARDALSPVFPYVTSGDGIYADGSLIQHTRIPYTGTYGAVLLDGLARMLTWLDGSPWAVTDPARQNIFDSVENAFAPFLFNGLMMDGQSGRGVSRGISADPLAAPQNDHTRGHEVIASVLLLAGSASAREEARWRGLAKGWLVRDYWSEVAEDRRLDVPALARCVGALNDPGLTPTPEPIQSRIFPNMDRAVHRRAGWAFAVSMCSSRTSYYEYGNGENPRGWHANNGMTYYWGATSGNGQYSDGFWPTVDPYRLPGTTVSRKPLADGQGGNFGKPRPATTWAGGATDGLHSVLGQHLSGYSSTLKARKSWFCLRDSIVCLGAGITATDRVAIESTVDNRNLSATGNTPFTVDGIAKPTEPDWSETLTGAGWAHLKGVAGYIFPGGATLQAKREERTASWRDIHPTGSPEPFTRRYLTLWFDHGVDPSNATYAYVLMPGASAARTAARAADSGWLTILANTEAQQGVSADGVTAVNFWAPGTVGPITVDRPASVLIRQTGSVATICVSDPSRTTTSVTLTWDRPVVSVLAKDPSVTAAKAGAALRLQIAVGGTAGATHRVKVRLG